MTHPIVLVGCESVVQRLDLFSLFTFTNLVHVGNSEECGGDLGEPFGLNHRDLVHVFLCTCQLEPQSLWWVLTCGENQFVVNTPFWRTLE